MWTKWTFQDQSQDNNKEDKTLKNQYPIFKLLKFKTIFRFLIN